MQQVDTGQAGGSPRSLVVLGMHRSGTSAITGALRLCGAWVGEDDALAAASAANPTGFWERRDLRAICDALLFGAGADWWKVAGFSSDAVPPATLAEQALRFRDLVARLDAHGTWIIKEPRLCLLFPLLRPFLDDPVCLLAYRHPLEIAHSLRARNGFGISEGLALWEAYTRGALRASAGLPRLLVSYEQLVGNPRAEMARLVDTLSGLGVAGLTTPDHHQIDGFVSPTLWRQRSESEDDLDFLTAPQRRLWSDLQTGRALEANITDDVGFVARQHLRDLESRVAPTDFAHPDIVDDNSEDDHWIQIEDARRLEGSLCAIPDGPVVVMPSLNVRRAYLTARMLLRRAGMPTRVVIVEDTLGQGFIRTLNAAAEKITARYLVYLAEDAMPGTDWLRIAFDRLEASGRGLLGFNDGKWHGRVAAFGMVRTRWVKSLYGGPVFYPHYSTHRADNELTALARATGQYEYGVDAVLLENDPRKIFRAAESAAQNFSQDDRTLFSRRFDTGFGGLVQPHLLAPIRADYIRK